jgi:hypothetical protein
MFLAQSDKPQGVGDGVPKNHRSTHKPDEPNLRMEPGADPYPVTARKRGEKGLMLRLPVPWDTDGGAAWKLGEVDKSGFLLTEGGFGFRISRVKPNTYDGLLFVTGPHVCKGRKDGFSSHFPRFCRRGGLIVGERGWEAS